MANKNDNNIIIKKVKKGHHGHHGGAWKIAYADFVTAMMAFFLLLWLLNAVPAEKLQGISDYFSPTMGLVGEMGIGVAGGTADVKGNKKESKGAEAILVGAPGTGPLPKLPQNMKDQTLDEQSQQNFVTMESEIRKAITSDPATKDLGENLIIRQTAEGLKIELIDSEKRPMFVDNTDILQNYTMDLLQLIAQYIKYLPNYITIDGHTTTFSTDSAETWLMSALRAEATRKFLVNGNLDKEQIYSIEGKGDQDPLDKQNPNSPTNRRIGITLLDGALVPFQKRVAPVPSIEQDE